MQDRKKGGSIKAIDTTIRILSELRELDGATLTMLAENLSVSKSTIHRHLKSLKSEGFVTTDGDKYYIGLEFLNYGIDARRRYNLYEVATSTVDELAEETGERAWLTVEENGYGRLIYEASGKHPVRPPVQVGQLRHLHVIASGKAILAHLPGSRIDRIIDHIGLPQYTPETITSAEKLRQELEATREKGYAVNHGESIPGLSAVAAPVVHQQSDNVLGGIAVSGPTNRFSGDLVENRLPDLIRGAANELEINVTYSDD